MLSVTTEPETSVRRRLTPDRVAVALLILIPLIVFVVPAALGHPIMQRDDADQNFPLRVLVGRQLSAGHLPLLNPYIWSGAPLLAGWNAGAAYPFTWLFAILPDTAAWATNEVICYVTAGVGLYVFLRHKSIRPLGAWLGAVTFAMSGSFAIQVEHFGLVAGVSWVPWALLALSKLSGPLGRRGRVGWATLLGIFGAMCILAGEPRAIDDAAVVLGLYALWLLIRSGPLRWWYFGSAVAGVLLAVCLSGVQWLPGLHAVSGSQRAEATYDLFSSGSLHIPWLSLLTVPVLLGGSGSFQLPGFFSGYNLPEIAYYVGLFPLVGAIALLGTLRRGKGTPEFVIWHIIAGVGLILALGGHTPLGPVLYHLPLFGSQRLQSRNVMITDVAIAVLFGYWVERWLASPKKATALGLVPIGVAAFFCILGMAAPGVLAPLLGVPRASRQVARMLPMYGGYLGIAVLTAAVLLIGVRLRGRLRAGLLTSVLVLDLSVTMSTVVVYVNTRAPGPHDAIVHAASQSVHEAPLRVPVSAIGRDGRFLVYGPNGVDSYDLGGVGITDLNVQRKTYTMQGYSAIVDGHYASVTGTHMDTGQGHNTVSLKAVGDGTLDQLNAHYLMTLPRYLLSNSATEASNPVTRTVAAGASTTWFLGQSFDLSSVSVPVEAGRARVGLLLPDGTTQWLPVGQDTPAHPVAATGVVAQALGGSARVSSPSTVTTGGARLVADGALQQALSSHDWQFAGNLDTYSVFTNPSAKPLLSLQPLPGKSLGSASVHRLTGNPLFPTSARVASANGALVVRSVSAIPGWTAKWAPAGGGDARTLPIKEHGLVQAVAVPAGQGVLSWRYDPPGFRVGAVLSLVGLAGLVGSGAYVAAGRRRSTTIRGR